MNQIPSFNKQFLILVFAARLANPAIRMSFASFQRSNPPKNTARAQSNPSRSVLARSRRPGLDLHPVVQAKLRIAASEERHDRRFFDDKPGKAGEERPASEKPPSREPCDKKCGTSGGPYGNTECEIDLKSGLLTGKVTKEVFDKNPCTRPCVDVHEGVHAKKIAPVCAATKKCLDAARGDMKKQNKCLDQFEADMNALTFSTECAAYTAEEPCLSKRAKKADCTTKDGKKRWDEQMKMVKCYKECFCKA